MKFAAGLALSVALAGKVLGLAAPTSDSESLGLTGGGLEPRGGDKSPPPLSDYKKIDCSAYATSRSLEGIFFESLTKNIEYFASTTKTKVTVPPNKCFQVGCWEDVGVWWCNDNNKEQTLRSWQDVKWALTAVPTLGLQRFVSHLDTNDATGGTTITFSIPHGSELLKDCHEGDSIAINGCCLTVTSFTPSSFKVGVAPETLRVTNLGDLKEASRVNLERAVRADTRMGGHFVQGHVDSIAEILSVTPDGNALTFRFRPRDRATLRYIIYKGFIAIDGTSLTITKVDDAEGFFEIMLIAYSQERVVLAQKKQGDTVNIEVDMMAKYAEKSLLGILGVEGSAAMPLLEKMVERIVAQGMGAKA
ncbi:riboflavin synthase alpha chain [Purpureocillium lilacinum]|uniref:Riboflavin synthase n=1 Tax=Purpureocillium lilacinum TaxID=33203 RepID=A0A179HMW4_PURLI|nr:riboflavin synthase alpha chain [Purpureocillium lilacinum]OAQ91766.1 riboflavin synthase alpha chain [Purpureocillium lilacinum]